MGILSTIDNWRTKIFLWIGLPLIAVAGLLFGALDVLPAWQARSGGGTIGTFTAEREECSRRTCSIYGAWAADDGSSRRADIRLYDEPDNLANGDKVPARDTGARGVFATAGGNSYLFFTGFALAGLAALIGWVFVIRNALRKRKTTPTPVPAS